MSPAKCSAARYCLRVMVLSNLVFRDTTQTKSTSKITSLLRWNVDVSWSAFSTRSSLPFSNASYCPAWRGTKLKSTFVRFGKTEVKRGGTRRYAAWSVAAIRKEASSVEGSKSPPAIKRSRRGRLSRGLAGGAVLSESARNRLKCESGDHREMYRGVSAEHGLPRADSAAAGMRRV